MKRTNSMCYMENNTDFVMQGVPVGVENPCESLLDALLSTDTQETLVPNFDFDRVVAYPSDFKDIVIASHHANPFRHVHLEMEYYGEPLRQGRHVSGCGHITAYLDVEAGEYSHTVSTPICSISELKAFIPYCTTKGKAYTANTAFVDVSGTNTVWKKREICRCVFDEAPKVKRPFAEMQGLSWALPAVATALLGYAAYYTASQLKSASDASQVVKEICREPRPAKLLEDFVLPENVVHWLKTHKINVVHASTFAFDVFAYLHGNMPSSILVLKATEIFGIFGTFLTALLSTIREWVLLWQVKKDPNNPSAVADMQGLLSALVPMAAAGLSLSLVRDLAKDFHLVVQFARDSNCFLLKLLEWLPNCVRRVFAKIWPDKAWAVVCSDLEVQKTVTECDNMMVASNLRKLIVSQPDRQAFCEVVVKIREIRRRLDEVGGNGELYRHISDLMRRVENLEGTFAAVDTARTERLTPFCVCFIGAPGTGKTMITRRLAHEFVASESEIYSRIFGSAFWDGYNGQKVVIIDDAFAMTKPEFFLEFIQGVSGTAFYPPLASMENSAIGIKGTPLTADVFIVSTNVASPQPTDMPYGRDAVARRRHACIEARSYLETHPFRFVDKWDTRQVLSEWLDYDQLVEKLRPMIISHRENEQMLLDQAKASSHRLVDTISPSLDAAMMQGTIADTIWEKELKRLEDGDVKIAVDESLKDLAEGHTVLVQSGGTMLLVEKREVPESFKFELCPTIEYGVAAVTVLGAVCAAYGVYRLYNHMTTPAEELAAVAQYTTYSDPLRRTVQLSRPTSMRAATQGTSEERSLLQCLGVVTVRNGDNVMKMNCLHTQSVLLVPAHLILHAEVNEGTMLTVTFSRYGWSKVQREPVTFNVLASACGVIQADGKQVDLASIPLPRHVQRAPNHSSYFMDAVRINACPAFLCTINELGDLVQRYCNAKRNVRNVQYGNSIMTQETDHSWWYDVHTAKGDCGSLLLGEVAGKTYVLGLHVALYKNNEACACAIGRQEYDALCSIGTTIAEQQGTVADLPRELHDSEMCFLSRGEHQSHIAIKSALKPSLLYRPDCIRVPAALSRSDPRIAEEHRHESPLYKAVAKYSHPGGGFDDDDLSLATSWAIKTFCVGSNVPRIVFPEHVAINGAPDLGFSSIEMATSPGYPYKKTGRKVDFFEKHDMEYSAGPVLRERLDRRLDGAKAGDRVTSIWADSLKDELLPLEKVRIGKTRLVTCPPLDFTILFRQYFGAFIHHIHTLCLKTPSCVGMDACSNQWNKLACKLQVHPNLFDSDISNNDGQFPGELVWAVYDVIDAFYDQATDEERLVRRIMIDEIINTVELAGSLLYMKVGGNPSGNPGTTIFNTVGNAIMFAYCWFNLAPPDMKTTTVYDRHVSNFFFGDDHIGCVSKEAGDFYHPAAVAQVFTDVGRKMTSGSKKGPTEWTTFADVTFLKRRFGLIPEIVGQYVSLLDEKTLSTSICYIRNTEDPVGACFDIVNDTLMEWAHYGRPVFEEKRRDLCEALDTHMTNRHVVTWFEAISHLRGAYYATAQMQGGGEAITQNVTAGGEEIQPTVDQYPAPTTNFPDSDWNLQQAADRWINVGAVGAAVGAVSGTVLFLSNMPVAFFSNISNMGFRNFAEYRGDTKVRLDVSGSKFHTGKIIIGFRFPYLDAFNFEPYSLMGGTHAIIDVNGSSSTVLDFPFWNTASSIYTANTWGTLYVMILSPIQAAAGADAQIDLNLYMGFPNAQFFVPKSNVPALVSATRSRPLQNSEEARALTRAAMQGNSITKYNTQNYSAGTSLVAPMNTSGDAFDAKNEVDPTMSTAVGVGGSTPSANITPPIATDQKPPTLTSQGKGALLAKDRDKNGLKVENKRAVTFNLPSGNESTAKSGTKYPRVTGDMDLEGSNFDPILTWNTSRPQMFNSCNVEPLQQFRTYPGAESIVTNDDFGTVLDEERVDYLVRKPGWIGVLTIPSSCAAYDPVCQIPVCPAPQFVPGLLCNYSVFAGFNLVRPNWYVGDSMPWCTLLSSLCQFWTGDLEFTFLFSSGSFTAGKILFAYSGETVDADNPRFPNTVFDANNQYQVVYDLANEDKRLTLRIPWMNRHQALSTFCGQRQKVQPHYPSLNGMLNIFILNAPTTSTGQPSNIYIDMFISGGPNFQLAGPSGQNSFTYTDDLLALHWPAHKVPWPYVALSETSPALAKETPETFEKVEMQGDEIKTAQNSTSSSHWTNEAVVMVKFQRSAAIAQLSGERFASLRDLFKKRWLCGSFIIPVFGASTSGGLINMNALLACMPYYPILSTYAGVRGSLRVTIEVRGINGNEIASRLAIVHVPRLGDICSQVTPRTAGSPFVFTDYTRMFFGGATGFPVTPATPATALINGGSIVPHTVLNPLTNACCTIEIPWSFIDRAADLSFMYPNEFTDNGEGPWGWLLLGADPCQGASAVEISVYAGFGDDFRFGRLWRNPYVKVDLANATAVGNPWW